MKRLALILLMTAAWASLAAAQAPAKGSALDISAEPLAGCQSLLARSARPGPLCGSQREQSSRNEPHSGPVDTPLSRRITLEEAVQLARTHNHNIRIADYTVEEKRRVKEAARSAYFPSIRNDSSYLHVTDTQLVEIGAGSLGVAGGTPIPPSDLIINQGSLDLKTVGTQVTQPLTTLLKIKPANDMADAELKASRETAQLTVNDIALEVRQVYYTILVAQSRRNAVEARIKASQNLQRERVEQVKFGSSLEQDLLDSRAQLLQARHELLTTDLQLSDFKLKLNDLIGLPLNTDLDLDPTVADVHETCGRQECVRAATASHPEITRARYEVEKAEAAIRLAKADIVIPDIDVFGRYSYQHGVPFLARNFGTFGVQLHYDLFDGGRKRATLGERAAQLSRARENLARLEDHVTLAVETAYNKLERTQQMMTVSEEVVALRVESNRVQQQELLRGAALISQADMATAQEYDAKTLLVQSQLNYVQAQDELLHAMGRTP
jgi:outer membrane protein TolC